MPSNRGHKPDEFYLYGLGTCIFCGASLLNQFPSNSKLEEDVIVDLGYQGKSWRAHNKCFLAWQVGQKLLE